MGFLEELYKQLLDARTYHLLLVCLFMVGVNAK